MPATLHPNLEIPMLSTPIIKAILTAAFVFVTVIAMARIIDSFRSEPPPACPDPIHQHWDGKMCTVF